MDGVISYVRKAERKYGCMFCDKENQIRTMMGVRIHIALKHGRAVLNKYDKFIRDMKGGKKNGK